MSITVVAFIRPLPAEVDAVRAALLDSIPKVLADDEGCELYALHDVVGGPEPVFLMVEKWASADAVAAHGAGPHFTGLSAALEGRLTSPLEVTLASAVPAGDGRGTL